MLKHKAHADALRVKEQRDGLDFYFGHRSLASKFVDFVQNVVPARCNPSKKLISQDFSSNTTNYTYSFSVEIAPVCKDDLVLLPPKIAHSLGSITPLLLVSRITSMVHLIDPLTLQYADLNTQQYWFSEMQTVADKSQLQEYHVLDIEPIGMPHGKYIMADVTVVKDSDFGRNNTTFTTKTHLGALLKPGDLVMGYDMSGLNSSIDFVAGVRHELPDVLLVRKQFHVPRRRKRRVFKLARLEKEELELKGKGKKDQEDKHAKEYEIFLRDLEEDPEMRSKITMFRKGPQDEIASETGTNAGDAEEDPTFPEVKLEELVAELSLN